MPRLRTGLYSLDVRGLGVLPMVPSGSLSPTGSVVTPIAPSGRVPGTGVGLFPKAFVYALRSSADRGGGLAMMHGETQDGRALHTLRDQLTRQLRSGLSAWKPDPSAIAASYVKALLDVSVSNANSEARLNEGLAAFWPGMTVVQLRRDLVGGAYASGVSPALPAIGSALRAKPAPTPTLTIQRPTTLSPGGGGFTSRSSPSPAPSGGVGVGPLAPSGVGPLDTAGMGPGLPANVAPEIPRSVPGSTVGSTAPNVTPGPCELLASWLPRNVASILHGEEWGMILMMVPTDTRVCKIGDPIATGDGSILEQWVSFTSTSPLPSTSRGAELFAQPQRVLLDARSPALVWAASIPWLMPALAAVAGLVVGAVIVRVAT